MNSEIVLHEGGGVTLSGPDAMALMKAATLRGAIRMHKACGMIPTRGVGPKQMKALATEITRKPYKGKEWHAAAIADLDTWIATMKAALPVTDNRR